MRTMLRTRVLPVTRCYRHEGRRSRSGRAYQIDIRISNRSPVIKLRRASQIAAQIGRWSPIWCADQCAVSRESLPTISSRPNDIGLIIRTSFVLAADRGPANRSISTRWPFWPGVFRVFSFTLPGAPEMFATPGRSHVRVWGVVPLRMEIQVGVTSRIRNP